MLELTLSSTEVLDIVKEHLLKNRGLTVVATTFDDIGFQSDASVQFEVTIPPPVVKVPQLIPPLNELWPRSFMDHSPLFNNTTTSIEISNP